MTIADNYRRIKQEIAAAAQRSGRDPNSVQLIGVTKTVDREAVDQAYEAGVRLFGENRVQDAKRKFEQPLPDDAELHLIGYLQTNKARDAVALFGTIHSVDRSSLVDALAKRAEQMDKQINVLLQVNIAGEEQKHGCAPDEVRSLLEHVADARCLRPIGLMTIAPLVQHAEETRPIFRQLRELRDKLQRDFPTLDLSHLSMGMTNDYQVAVEEGATMVRVGRAMFNDC